MATYTKSKKTVPSYERAVLITAVAAGDKIDIIDVLGRPAKSVVFKMTNTADIITYKINHASRIRTAMNADEVSTNVAKIHGVLDTEVVLFWNPNTSTFTGTGNENLEIVSGLRVSSIEIGTLTLSTGTTISIAVS